MTTPGGVWVSRSQRRVRLVAFSLFLIGTPLGQAMTLQYHLAVRHYGNSLPAAEVALAKGREAHRHDSSRLSPANATPSGHTHRRTPSAAEAAQARVVHHSAPHHAGPGHSHTRDIANSHRRSSTRTGIADEVLSSGTPHVSALGYPSTDDSPPSRPTARCDAADTFPVHEHDGVVHSHGDSSSEGLQSLAAALWKTYLPAIVISWPPIPPKQVAVNPQPDGIALVDLTPEIPPPRRSL